MHPQINFNFTPSKMEYEEYQEEVSKRRKIIIMIIGIILIILIISYFVVSFPIFQIIGSLSESNIATNQRINLTDFSIIFSEEIYKELQKLYYEHPTVEFVVCLNGKKNKDYEINSLYVPEVIEQSFNHIRFRPCSQDTLIVLHSHPYRHCIGSEQDLIHLKELKNRNKNSLILIMCEENRFTVYK